MKPMIQAHLVERDQFGFWTHPNYPDLADNCSSSEAQETLRRLGLELQTVFMESDAPRLYDSARSDQRYSEWIPTRPEGSGWFVLSIHDTDNGPVCQYVRPLGEHLSPIDLDAAAEQHERLLSEACAKALNQRDAALAEVERLRQFERICEGLPQDAIDGGWTVQGIRGYAKRLEDQLKAALARVADMKTMADNYCALLMDANAKLAEMERQEPVALANRGLHAFWVKWTEAAAGLYGPGIKLYAAPVAQAQHSVPVAREQLERLVRILDAHNYAKDAEALMALLAAAPGKEVPQAWLDVQAERRRQVEAEGWTPEHDDLYCAAELPRAAAAYILNGANDEAPAIWPFSAKWWKPRDARSNYVRASALILAEIERLDRAAPGKEGV